MPTRRRPRSRAAAASSAALLSAAAAASSIAIIIASHRALLLLRDSSPRTDRPRAPPQSPPPPPRFGPPPPVGDRFRPSAGGVGGGGGVGVGVNNTSCRCPLLDGSRRDLTVCGALDGRVSRDLAPYSSVGMTSDVLDTAYEHVGASNLAPSFHFSVRDNVIRYKKRNEGAYQRELMSMLRALRSGVKLPDVEFVLNTWDHPKVPRHDRIPLLSPACDASHGDIVYPYMYAWDAGNGGEEGGGRGYRISDSLRERCSEPPSRRIPRAHFRGGCTGPEGGYRGALYPYYPRARANALSAMYPELIDAGLVKYCADTFEEDAKFADRMTELAPPLPENSPDDWCDYRYYLLLDGNTVSGRSTHVAQMGFVLFKPESNFYEYWYELMVPWVHYVPVDESLNDLPDMVRWANGHPVEAERMARNLRDLSEVIVRDETWMCYWWRLLEGLSELQVFRSRTKGFPYYV